MPPKPNQRERIIPRLSARDIAVPMSSTGGRSITVAASPTQALGDLRSSQVFMPDRYRGEGGQAKLFAGLSSTFRNIAERFAAASQPVEETPAEKVIRRQKAAVDAVAGTCLGNQICNEVDAKTKSGEWTLDDAEKGIASRYSEAKATPELMKAARPFAMTAIEKAQENDAAMRLARQREHYMNLASQGFDAMHASYDPERPEDYVAQRDAIWSARDTLGIRGVELDEMEFASLEKQAMTLAADTSWKSQALLDLAKQDRPDGSPSLVAVLQDGEIRFSTLQDKIADTTIAAAEFEDQEAERLREEMTRDNFTRALSAVGEMAASGDFESLSLWEMDNLRKQDEATLSGRYGDFLDDLKTLVKDAQANAPGDELTFAQWMLTSELGDDSAWEAVRLDPRLNPQQKAQLFAVKRGADRLRMEGRVSDARLANTLVAEMDIQIGTPEAAYYQAATRARLKEVDKGLEPLAYNQEKARILDEVRMDIVSGRIKPPEPVKPNPEHTIDPASLATPQPQPQEQPPQPRITDEQAYIVAKRFRTGDISKLREDDGFDLFSLDEDNYRKVMREVQRQDARLKAAKANTLLSYMADKFWEEMPDHSEKIMEYEQRVIDENDRMLREGFEADRRLMLGEELSK